MVDSFLGQADGAGETKDNQGPQALLDRTGIERGTAEYEFAGKVAPPIAALFGGMVFAHGVVRHASIFGQLARGLAVG